MKRKVVLAVCIAVALWFMVEASISVAGSQYATLTGTVVGVHRGLRKWLDVKSDKDQAAVDFRVGKKTVYVPHRYPYTGERVRIEYLTERGVKVAYVVTVIK